MMGYVGTGSTVYSQGVSQTRYWKSGREHAHSLLTGYNDDYLGRTVRSCLLAENGICDQGTILCDRERVCGDEKFFPIN